MIVLILGTICSSINAGTKTIVFKLAHTNTPQSFVGKSVDLFADIVEKETNGRVKIDIYHSGTLGSSRESVESFKVGTLEMLTPDPATLAQIYPDVGVFSLPYLFRDGSHALKAVNPKTSTVMRGMSEKLIKESGIRVLGGYWRGFRQLTMNSPVYKPEDLRKKKVRAIPNPVWIATVEGMGAVATPVDFTELPSALMTGIVDGQENPIETIYESKFYPPVQKYLMITNHLGNAMLLAIREEAWRKLSPTDQIIFENAITEVGRFTLEEEARIRNQLLTKLKDQGMTIITEDNGLDTQAFRSKVLSHVQNVFPEWAGYIEDVQAIE